MRVTLTHFASIAVMAVLLAGCAAVHTTTTPNAPGPGVANLTGMPTATTAHFDTVYPPGSWPEAAQKRILVIGPILASREALLLLAPETDGTLTINAAPGKSSAAVEISNGPGEPRLLTAEHFDDEVRAILKETIVTNGMFTVADPAGALSATPDSERLMDELRRQGVNYLVDGNLVAGENESKTTRLYLRLVDVVTRKVQCAASAEGNDVRDVARAAARQLLSQIGK